MVRRVRRLAAALTALASGTGVEATANDGAARRLEETVERTAIEHVRLFDGESVREDVTVVFSAAGIEAVGEEVEPPAGARRIAGAGRTLLPGLIDAHTHSWGNALERAALFGVTTVLDMFTEPGWAAERRAEQRSGKAHGRADLFSAGVLATAAGGHGTQFGLPVTTLEGAADAEDWVAARVAEGSDWIKIVVEDGTIVGRPLPTLDRATVAALAEAAHEHHRLAVAHATTLASAQMAVAAGVDGLVHIFCEEGVPGDWIATVARSGLFVVPTLTVVESTTGTPSGVSLTEDAAVAPFLGPAERASLRRSFPGSGSATLGPALAAVGRLHAAGVPILAGSDAPNPGTAHGASLHRELELLVAAGLTPAAALRAATAATSDVFGLADRGRVAPGLKADLLLVDGDPTRDVVATRRIAAVWKDGAEVERAPAAAGDRLAAGPGPVSDFEDGTAGSRIGTGWSISVDEMMGGASSADMEVVAVAGGGHALRVEGEVRPGFAHPWAGAMLFPGTVAMEPVDLSAAPKARFRVRGAAGTYRLLVFAEAVGPIPASVPFEAGGSWREVEVDLSKVAEGAQAGITGLLWSAGPEPGPFWLEVDDVELAQ